MILSGNSIAKEVERANIVISDFDISRLNPNSYNVRLADEILVYENALLDMKHEQPYEIKKIPERGFALIPGRIYLARTMEYTETTGFVPMLEGRSSIGRLGIFIHATAGFGDNGFKGYWTLELSTVQPTIIYPGVEIAQLYFHTILDDDEDGLRNCPITYEHGKYQNNKGIQPSMIWKEFEK